MLQSSIEVGEKPKSCLQSRIMDFSFLDSCSVSEVIRSPAEHSNKFKNVYQLRPIVSRENRTLKKKNLNHDQNSYIQDDPAQVSSDRMMEGTDDTNEPAKEHSINLLLVDDDRDILFTFKSILAAAGYNVEAFADPSEALSHFTQAGPSYYNLVITDIRMPKINGFQLYQKLKEINTDVRVLFMTAFEVPGNLQDTLPSIKDSDIIRKPIEEEHFVNRIKTAVSLG